jgi:hypothetical protein
MLGGSSVAVFSGLLLFSTDLDMYYLNWSFLIELTCLVLLCGMRFACYTIQTA